MTDAQFKRDLISVLLPVYNGEAFLEKSIQSVLNQTYANFECIIIDDGSTDGSASIIEKYRDPRIIFYHQENRGLAATLNRAISIAKGEYLARQDQDDVSLPERFGKQISFLKTHPHCGMVGTWAEIWSGNSNTGRVHKHPTDNLMLKFELLFDNPFVHSSMMLRKTVVEKAGMYSLDSSRQPPEDYELWSRIARLYEIANIQEILLIYREMPESMSRMGSNPFFERLLRISSENIAFAAGRKLGDNHCNNLAALAHGAYQRLDPQLQYRTMADVLCAAADGLCTPKINRNSCDLAKRARNRMRTMWLRYVIHRYFGFSG